MADGSPSTLVDEHIVTTPVECAACGAPVEQPCGHDEGGHSIHRDGFCIGPEVPLCCACGAYEFPSCPTLWRLIAGRRRGS
jgi:hypothetical protein